MAGPAQAFDGGECNRAFGHANVVDVDQIAGYDSGVVGKVDFGDHLHLFGRPQATAVVCFANTGAALLKGYLFSDPDCLTYANVKAVVEYSGQGVQITRPAVKIDAPTVVGGGLGCGGPLSKLVSHLVRQEGATISKVDIKLYANGAHIHTLKAGRGGG